MKCESTKHLSSLDELLNAALSYASRGWPVLPLAPGEKKPLRGTQGYKSARTDIETLQNYWKTTPFANIGIRQNGTSLAVDVDPRNGGADSFERLIKEIGPLPQTLTVNTPSGGRHYKFILPADHGLPSKITLNSTFKGIDFLIDKSYLVAPPSQHPNGGIYEWTEGLGPDEIEMAEAPAPLIEILRSAGAKAVASIDRPDTSNSGAAHCDTSDQQVSDVSPKLGSILAGCAFMRYCRDNAEHLTEPEWFAMLSIAGQCQNGHAAGHKLSLPYPGYSSSETDAKLEHATQKPPRTCKYIESELGFAGCVRCPFRAGDMATPATLGFQPEALVILQSTHVFDIGTSRFHDIVSFDIAPMGKQAFSDKFRHVKSLSKPLPDSQFLSSRTAPKVDDVDYLPGALGLIQLNGAKRVLNLWKDTGVAPAHGDYSIIANHLNYILPDDDFREFVLNAWASLTQNPQTKLPAILITGGQGIGKSFLHRLWERIVGSENIRKLESEALNSRFRAAMGNVQVLVFDELMQSGRLEISDMMKDWISEEFVMAEEKNVRQHSVRTPRLIMAFSNYDQPIYTASNDRRWAIYNSPSVPETAEYYSRLFSDGLAQAAAFKQYLADRDISDFNPSARPPITLAKLELIRNSKTPLAFELQSLLDDERPPFDKALVTVDDVRRAIWQFGSRANESKQVERALKEIGARPLANQVRVRDGKRRYWSLRDHERWAKSSAKEIRQYLGSGESAFDLVSMLPGIQHAGALSQCLTSQEINPPTITTDEPTTLLPNQ